MPERVEEHVPQGVDYAWVMQATFVATIVIGAPLVAALATQVSLPTWGARAGFAIRVGAAVWFASAIVAYLWARRRQSA